jgi:hypothetical protein
MPSHNKHGRLTKKYLTSWWGTPERRAVLRRQAAKRAKARAKRAALKARAKS